MYNEQIRISVEYAKNVARQLQVACSFAVVDPGGHLVYFERMPNVLLASVELACKKAKTSAYLDMSTEDVGKLGQPGGQLYSIAQAGDGFILFAGGMPLNIRNELVCAIGVSGGTVEQDKRVVQAFHDELKRQLL